MNKKYCYFIFEGYTKAVSASEILKINEIKNKIVKAPVQMRNCCSFAVVIFAGDAGKCEKIFNKNNCYFVLKRYM